MNAKGSFKRAAKAALGNRGWVGLTPDLLKSDAWRTLSVHELRFIFCLMLDHLAHGGTENGELVATYDQLVAYGISRRFIREAIDGTVAKGLVTVVHQGSARKNGMSDPSRYRLTFLQWKLNGATGPEAIPPTHEWRRYARSNQTDMIMSTESKQPSNGQQRDPHPEFQIAIMLGGCGWPCDRLNERGRPPLAARFAKMFTRAHQLWADASPAEREEFWDWLAG